jgi:hypothetical protein
MNAIWNIIFEWRYVIIVVIGVAIYAAFEWKKFTTLCYKVMLAAKEGAQNMVIGAGKEEEDWVVSKLMILIPIKFNIIGEDKLRIVVHWLFGKMKDLADNGHFDNSFPQE